MIPLLLMLVACKAPEPGPDEVVYPRLVAPAARKAEIASRLDQTPYDAVLAVLRDRAARDYREEADPAHWDQAAHGTNGETAQANAMLAWLLDDEAAAEKAIDFLDRLPTDFATNDDWDVNIRMPGPLIGHANAVDLLLGTDFYDEEDADPHIDKLVELNDAFWEGFVEDDLKRQALLGSTQNNHPIRTAAAIAYISLFFPRGREAEDQAAWALSELDYLWGPNGQYVQPDGGVSEGPFYYEFAFGPSIALFIAMDNAADPDRVFHRDCRNRQDVDPWAGHGCVEGEPFTFDNPLHGDAFASTVAWWIGLRLPDGNCPPLADAYFNPMNGGALLSEYTGDGIFQWNWEHNVRRPEEMTHGMDLVAHHLVYLDPEVPAVEPETPTRILPDAGDAVLRSGWDPDARWLLLLGEHGSARKTVHDHVDGTSFTMAAYGEYLLVDPGYYKEIELSLPETAQPEAHNLILVDGRGAPRKGLLTNWGDADASLQNGHDGDLVDYAEAWQSYEDVDFERSAAMLRDRYFVVADRLQTERTDAREFAWRLGGYAGLDSGGTFTVGAATATWERALAGVDVHLASTAPALALVEPPYREKHPPHVHLFELDRSLGHHGVVDGEVTAVDPGFLAVLAPYRVGDDGADGALVVTPLDVGDGAAAYTVVTEGALDLVLLREPTAPNNFDVAGVTLATDGELAVVSLEGPPLALLARGTTLSVDGAQRLAGPGDGVTFTD